MRQTWRLTVIAGGFLFLFSMLVLRLWYLQVSTIVESLDVAEAQQLSTVSIEPPRGNIYDRSGRLMAGTEAAMRVVVDRKLVPDGAEEGLVRNLAALLDIPAAEVREAFTDDALGSRFTIGGEVSERVAMFVWEHNEEFPGVAIEPQPVRVYPLGEQAAHLIGYVGAPGPADLERPEISPRDRVGKFGVEGSYDRLIRGSPGTITYRVNARGQILGIVGETPPLPGGSVYTTIDLHIQTVLEAALVDGMRVAEERGSAPVRAAGVVLDPSNGAVLAMASVPAYDPALFSSGTITQEAWETLAEKAVLNNFAIQGNYPPASAFKVIPYVVALEESIFPTIEQDLHAGRQNPNDPTSFYCDGDLQFPNTPLLTDWSRHGEVNIHTSLHVSCDNYYWGIALEIWDHGEDWSENLLQEWSRRLGFGSTTGIDLPFEQPGLVPDREWFQYHQVNKTGLVREEGGWSGGDVMNIAIGQGALSATPLQMAAAYATLINGGTYWAPRVVDRIVDGRGTVIVVNLPNARWRVEISPSTVASLKADLNGVVAGPRGTARVAFSEFCGRNVPAGDCPALRRVGGKTGTAEIRVAFTEEDQDIDTAWFVGVAPLDDPRYVVAIVIDEGGSGGAVAAPTARAVLQYLMGESVTPIRPGGEDTE